MYVYIYICTKKEELGNRQDPPRTLSIRHQGKGAGTGTAAYSSVEEVAQAIATLNAWPSRHPLVILSEIGKTSM